MKNNLIITVAMALTLSGCFEDKTLDATNKATIESSLKAIEGDLSKEQKEKFEEALQVVILSEIEDLGGVFAVATKDTDVAAREIYQNIDGKSADEIITLAKKKDKEQKKKQLLSMEQEIKELMKKKEEANQSAALLMKVEITNPKFYWKDQMYRSQPTIDFTIKNNTNVAILRGNFHGTVVSPSRTIPWISEDFSYKFEGGLEPGESHHLQLAPNMFGDWSVEKTKERKDLVLTIDVKNISDADDEKLAAEFAESDGERLEKLLKDKKTLIEALGVDVLAEQVSE